MVQATVAAMQVSWERILLELDGKLAAFHREQELAATPLPPLHCELLALLARGHASLELQAFLTREFTPRKLKALTQSIEKSLAALQRVRACICAGRGKTERVP